MMVLNCTGWKGKIMDKIRFVDTNILLQKDLEKLEEKIYISDITLKELESIKTSSRKDNEVKFQARVATRWLRNNEDKYEVIVADKHIYEIVGDKNLEIDNDNLIVACAYSLADTYDVTFETNDMCCYNIAKHIFELNCTGIQDKVEDTYKGYKEIIMTDLEMAKFYETENKENIYGLELNEYLIIKDTLNQEIDAWFYDGLELQQAKVKSINSLLFARQRRRSILCMKTDCLGRCTRRSAGCCARPTRAAPSSWPRCCRGT